MQDNSVALSSVSIFPFPLRLMALRLSAGKKFPPLEGRWDLPKRNSSSPIQALPFFPHSIQKGLWLRANFLLYFLVFLIFPHPFFASFSPLSCWFLLPFLPASRVLKKAPRGWDGLALTAAEEGNGPAPAATSNSKGRPPGEKERNWKWREKSEEYV
jgi:hypothetical protein